MGFTDRGRAGRPRALISWSSGKDSAWALQRVRQRGELEVVAALTTVTEVYDRVSMHGVRREVLRAQVDALELPLIEVSIPAPCPNEVYEAAMVRTMTAARGLGVEAVIFGDLFLADIRAYREARLAPLGVRAVFPLWGDDTSALADEMIAAGLRATVVCVDPRRVGRALAGAEFDAALVAGLPAGVDPCGEHGEFHTCVWAGPMFDAPLAVTPGEVVDRDGFVFADLALA
jgi:uncharacterized protein (TIGR00290 family)